jgi:hypothetical protein
MSGRIKNTAKSTRVLLGVLAVLIAGIATAALAASTVPPPTITGKPANPTASTSATFTFTGAAAAGGSYQCSLDSAAFAACTSPKTYTGLAPTSHTFRVLALDKNNNVSDPVSYTWTVDTTPPTVRAIELTTGGPTNASSVRWYVTFSESVTGVDATDFALVKTGITGGSSAVTLTGNGATYTATMASTGTGDGTVGLNLVDDDSIKDAATNVLAGAGANNGNFAGQIYTIDRTPPTGVPTIKSGPSGFVESTTATFKFASSDSDVASFRCQLDSGPVTLCTNPTEYTGLAESSHTLKVWSADKAGNVGAATATRTWTVDTVAPPAPVLVDKPDDPNGDGIANFTWTDSESPLTFQCSIENGAFTNCTSPYSTIVNVTNNGQHQFAVRAYDAAGHFSQTSYTWKVLGVNITIDGDVVGLMAPGVTRPIALTFHNPNNFLIKVTGVDISVRTSPPGCPAGSVGGNPANISLQQADITSAATVSVPANGQVTLPAQGHAAPTIRLNDTPLNQDACKGGTFGLSYVGRGVK